MDGDGHDHEIIDCLATPSLRAVISKMEQVEAGKKQGKWRIHKPDNWPGFHRYGHDLKGEIITEDFDTMKKFAADGFRVEVMEGKKKEVKAASNKQVEGKDVGKRGVGRPKNRPMTTHDLPGSARR